MCLCIGLYIFLILQFKVFNTVSLQQFYLQFFLPFLGMFLRCWNPNFLQLKLLTLEIGMIYDLNTVLPIIRDMVLDCNLIIVNLRNLRSTMSFLFFGTMAACHFLFFFFLYDLDIYQTVFCWVSALLYHSSPSTFYDEPIYVDDVLDKSKFWNALSAFLWSCCDQ